VIGVGLAHAGEFVAGVEDVGGAGGDVEAPGIPLGAGSVVGTEEDEGVLELAFGFEVSEDAADVLVHAVDHGGEDGHAAGEVLAAVGWDGVPGGILLFGPAVDVGDAIGADDGTGGHLPARVGEAELLHAGEALLSDHVPALLIDLLILIDQVLGGMEREVRGVVGQVQKPRLVLLLAGGVEERQGVVRDGVGGVEGLFPGGGGAAGGQARVLGRIPEAVEAVDHAVEVFKAAVDGAGLA